MRGTKFDSSTFNLFERPVKKRQGKPKVHSGCKTCKKRHVKCDEGRPSCKRCIDFGVGCDGYASMFVKKACRPIQAKEIKLRQQIIQRCLMTNPLLDFRGSPVEHRYLDFFRSQTGPSLSGFFDSTFWNRILPQVAESEPVIMHAMVAVASIHEQVEAEEYTPSQDDRFALEQYNKAIQQLTKRLAESKSEELTLMTCLLFICLEFLRGDVRSGITHMQSGLKIIKNWHNDAGRTIPSAAALHDPHSVAADLTYLFSRLSINAWLSGHPLSDDLHMIESEHIRIPTDFVSLVQARASAMELVRVALKVLRASTKYKYHPPSPEKQKIAGKQQAAMLKSKQWAAAFNRYKMRPTFPVSNQQARAFANLQILNLTAYAWLGNSLSPYEAGTDIFTAEFSEVIELATELDQGGVPRYGSELKQSQSEQELEPKLPKGFAFEMGVISSLYFAAIKCRDPTLRRRAISLLSTTQPRQEGLWDADFKMAIAKRVMEIEESNLTEKHVALGFRPPESARIHNALMHSQMHRRNDSDDDEGKLAVEKVIFISLPSGINGTWEVRTEELICDGDTSTWRTRPCPTLSETPSFDIGSREKGSWGVFKAKAIDPNQQDIRGTACAAFGRARFQENSLEKRGDVASGPKFRNIPRHLDRLFDGSIDSKAETICNFLCITMLTKEKDAQAARLDEELVVSHIP